MKAKIRKTGEIVDIISFVGSTTRDGRDWVSYIDSKGRECHKMSLNRYWDFEDIDQINDNVDWEQRRYDLAKRYSIEFVKLQHYQGRTECGILYSKVVGWSVELADELIAKLKEGGKE